MVETTGERVYVHSYPDRLVVHPFLVTHGADAPTYNVYVDADEGEPIAVFQDRFAHSTDTCLREGLGVLGRLLKLVVYECDAFPKEFFDGGRDFERTWSLGMFAGAVYVITRPRGEQPTVYGFEAMFAKGKYKQVLVSGQCGSWSEAVLRTQTELKDLINPVLEAIEAFDE